jgi:LysW-gamma-L-alpha-aminoadipyl-6-phosphate/LysW-L-glutamyl-5-phosphate reductase
MIRAAIVGGSGYAGGELLRLLTGHPGVEVTGVTSRTHAGRFVHTVHPNLRGHTALKFSTVESLEPCDVLFTCLPHGEGAGQMSHFRSVAERVIDLSADFRLEDAAAYKEWYDWEHPDPQTLQEFVYGLPETRREQLRSAHLASGVGCNATAVILALLPLARAGLIDRAVVDLKVGSSEGGNRFSLASHHPERSGSLRTFAPIGHRHLTEVFQELGEMDLHFTATAVEMVRGVLCTAHVFPVRAVEQRDLWQLYRETYAGEPFVRLVRDRAGIYRYPEPKIVAGTNYCDVGFEVGGRGERIVVISALDNLVKGAAGTAVQAMNLMTGHEETAGLTFTGLHPA